MKGCSNCQNRTKVEGGMKMELKDLKVGDKVYFDNSSYGCRPSILKIDRITKTQIICGNTKFRIDDGKLKGNYDCWHFPKIEILTDELRQKTRYSYLSDKLNAFRFQELSLKKLEKIKSIINEKEAE